MKRREFNEYMETRKYKKCISHLANESYIKNDIDVTWKINNFKCRKSPANVGTVSVKIDGKNFHIENIQTRYELEDAIRQAQTTVRTAPDFGALGVG